MLSIFKNKKTPFKQQDIELMLKFQKGDISAFESLVEKYYSKILNYCYRLLSNKEQAEDLTQEIFLKIYSHANKYKPTASFKTYLYTVAKNTIINETRQKKQIQNEPITEEITAETNLENQLCQNEQMLAVKEAIFSLPENQRNAIILRRYQELSYKEIAEVMKTSEKAIKSLLNRAMTNLEKKLSKFIKE